MQPGLTRSNMTPRFSRSSPSSTSHQRAASVKAIDALSVGPRPSGARPLVGYPDLWRIRVGDYRVVYTVKDECGRLKTVGPKHLTTLTRLRRRPADRRKTPPAYRQEGRVHGGRPVLARSSQYRRCALTRSSRSGSVRIQRDLFMERIDVVEGLRTHSRTDRSVHSLLKRS